MLRFVKAKTWFVRIILSLSKVHFEIEFDFDLLVINNFLLFLFDTLTFVINIFLSFLFDTLTLALRLNLTFVINIFFVIPFWYFDLDLC